VSDRREELSLKVEAGKPTQPRPIFREKLSVSSAPQLAGLPPHTGHHGPEPGPLAVRPTSIGWLSDELVADTRRVWSKAYGRVLSVDEAVEILTNLRRLAEVLLRAEQEGKQP
jgi:hypothetical protein